MKSSDIFALFFKKKSKGNPHNLYDFQRILLFLLFAILCSNHVNGQVLETKNWCLSRCDIVGDEKENAELAYLQLRNDSLLNAMELDSIRRIPLRIGIIQEDSIEVEIKEIDVRRAIDNLNRSFVDSKFVFYIERTDVILSDLKIEDLSQDLYASYNEFSDRYDEENLLSIYIFDHKSDFCTITETSISCGRTGGFSYILSARTNNLVLSRFDLSDIKVFAHEMGHFWGLFHTFEETLYGKDDFAQENCHLVGDRICDTPPDPGPLYEVYANYITCEMLNLEDEFGSEYKPLLENYMSYYKPCYLKEFSFTDDQIMVMKSAARLSIRSKYFR